MNTALVTFWYRRVLKFMLIIERLSGDDPMLAACNEGIRRIVNEAEGHISEVTETQEMVAVDWVEAS